MVHILPFGKLFAVLLKQISKPIASRIKSSAKTHPNLSSVCAYIGESMHNLTVRIFRSSRDQDPGAKIVALPREKAIDRGAEIIGETFLFAVVGGVTAYEVSNARLDSARKRAEKEARSSEKARIREEESMRRDHRISELESKIARLELEFQNLSDRSRTSPSD
mmetsp:Transcript_5390/g.9486  ORF Transcript_5390/g.9486 Transcript_5390/m.9486 type:complete len:164 (-) Transcript_5390:601-1092(-)